MPPKGSKRNDSAGLEALVGTCADAKFARIVKAIAEDVGKTGSFKAGRHRTKIGERLRAEVGQLLVT